jgi:hypothetical protein
MSEQNELVIRRQSTQSELEDLEFERFAVGMGCAPERIASLDEKIASTKNVVAAIDEQITSLEKIRLESVAQATPLNWSKEKVDDLFESLIKNL